MALEMARNLERVTLPEVLWNKYKPPQVGQSCTGTEETVVAFPQSMERYCERV